MPSNHCTRMPHFTSHQKRNNGTPSSCNFSDRNGSSRCCLRLALVVGLLVVHATKNTPRSSSTELIPSPLFPLLYHSTIPLSSAETLRRRTRLVWSQPQSAADAETCSSSSLAVLNWRQSVLCVCACVLECELICCCSNHGTIRQSSNVVSFMLPARLTTVSLAASVPHHWLVRVASHICKATHTIRLYDSY